jgi:MFS family permease
VADTVSEQRRGEAMSALGISGSLGMSVAPIMGSVITEGVGIQWMFGVSSVFALLSVLILVKNMEETLTQTIKFKPQLLKISCHEIFEPRAFPVFLVQFLLSFASGCVLTLTPDLSKHLNISNKGLFYGVFTASALVIRIFAAKSSDKYGRVTVLTFAALSVTVSMFLIAWSQSFTMFMVAAIIYGWGWGMCTPTLQAWTVDLVPAEIRGRGLATMFIALEAGIGIGAWLSQALYQNDLSRIDLPYYTCGILSFTAFLYLLLIKKE